MTPITRRIILKSASSAVIILLLMVSFLSVAEQASAEGSPGATARPSDSGQRTADGGTRQSDGGTRPDPADYLSNLYIWFLSFVGIAALFSIVRGGILYMFSGANITSTAEARKHINNAAVALLIAGLSYALLKAINPDLVEHGFDISQVINQVTRRIAP